MKETYNEIITFLKDYHKNTNCKGYVLGISGGKDSTVVAKLLVDAVGKENVLGVLMPNGKQSDLDDSKEICRILDIDYIKVNIVDSYEAIISQIERFGGSKFPGDYFSGITNKGKSIIISDKARTNIAPRLRMITLYAIAQSIGYRVAGTGNASEQFIGWFTKWGDGACDINPIAHISCEDVIKLGKYMELPEYLVDKTPTDGLTGKSDEDNFGFRYFDIDSILLALKVLPNYKGYILADHEVDSKIKEMHRNSRHKFEVVTIKK